MNIAAKLIDEMSPKEWEEFKRGMKLATNGDDCEHDCSYVCTGCDQYFHDIKNENELEHNKELPEYLRTDSGNYYCHPDCLRDGL